MPISMQPQNQVFYHALLHYPNDWGNLTDNVDDWGFLLEAPDELYDWGSLTG